jgi:hypothetical protein
LFKPITCSQASPQLSFVVTCFSFYSTLHFQLEKPLASANLMYSLALLGVDASHDKELLAWCSEAFLSQLSKANSQVGRMILLRNQMRSCA